MLSVPRLAQWAALGTVGLGYVRSARLGRMQSPMRVRQSRRLIRYFVSRAKEGSFRLVGYQRVRPIIGGGQGRKQERLSERLAVR
ncbi:hypothetical protein BDP81DRAFT_98254 [Colletotrichum phormii]|uniref:Uncharacterized protein n=1 Tax=Colletotrichum phormii TaxID=359342 RepID=A0AAJ0EAY5_9PEZI|nr:uncharacterized protein BDP81DRAFT_98254 [Colletotrichum phormii]KAK1625051.1 hypothetical protein BDP81DRAFT_98254 [Colletotrichum phormii]